MPLLPSGNCKKLVDLVVKQNTDHRRRNAGCDYFEPHRKYVFANRVFALFKGERKQLIPVEHYDRKDRSKLDHYQKYFQKLFLTRSV